MDYNLAKAMFRQADKKMRTEKAQKETTNAMGFCFGGARR